VDTGKTTICMGKECTHGVTAEGMRACMKETKNRAMESMCGLMAGGMRDSGRMVNSTEMEGIQGLMEIQEGVNGRRGKG